VLEAWCEVISEQGAWEEADEIVDRSRMHASWAGVPPLDLYAARLEGRAAAALGDPDRAVPLLASAISGFTALEARWEASTLKRASSNRPDAPLSRCATSTECP